MPITGRIGAVYVLDTAPSNFDILPERMEQAGVLFLWTLDIKQSLYRFFGDGYMEHGSAITGWHVTVEGYCGNEKLWTNENKIVFIKLFTEKGTSLKGFGGYAKLPKLAGRPNALLKEPICIEGIGKLLWEVDKA